MSSPSKQRTSISISVRRHFIDNFFTKNAGLITGRTLDIGGKKTNKRGLFDIGKYSSDITYVNIDKTNEPDIVADAASIPLPNDSFDTGIMGELLEHVPDPRKVIEEGYRLLKKDGVLLISVPFMVGMHGDPHDYGRYTETFWKMAAAKSGFHVVSIERQGTIFAVLALMLQHLFIAKKRSWKPIQATLIKFLIYLDKRTSNPLLTSWTTGYGIVLRK